MNFIRDWYHTGICWCEVISMVSQPSTNLRRPLAEACVSGAGRDFKISGSVRFYPFRGGVLVVADLHGLPRSRGACADRIFAFHIHEGGSCAGEGFPLTGGHFNPDSCPHPRHAGDLPPLFSNDGDAFLAVYTTRFTIPEIVGRTVIVHNMPDDFTTQPSGAAGEKIACGVIRRV